MLSIQEVTRYQSKLADARAQQSAVAGALACLASRESALVARRDSSQIRLGELLQQGQSLRANIVQQQAALDGHLDLLRQEQRNLEKLYGELRELQAKQAAQDQELRECKSNWWTPDFMCDFANAIAHLTGLFDDVGKKIQSSENRVNQARDGVSQSRSKVDDVTQELEGTTRSAAALDAEIRKTESEIGASQAELSALQEPVHRHQLLLDELAAALAQATQIHVDDGRMRTARELRDAAQRFDAGAARLAAAIAHAGEVLPAESAACLRR